MGATMDVDIGGTFTDCLVTLDDGRTAAIKTPTTKHRLAAGFMKTVQQAASQFEMSVEELLGRTDVVRYSTTVAMNTLIQRNGPKLALITTAGHEDVLRIARAASWTDSTLPKEIRNVAQIDKPEPLVERSLVVGARERVDCFGRVVQPLAEEHFLLQLRDLVDQGVRGFVVSLLFGYQNPVHERRIRELIESEYPEGLLGAMPIMLASEVLPKRWEYTRTNTTLLNAYLHQAMWEELAGMNDDLRARGYQRGIMMVHNTGGMAEVYQTAAVETFNGGPVAGLIGGAAIGRKLGHPNVIVGDMGGTSFDLGVVVDGSTRTYEFRPVIDQFWVDMTILQTRSIGAGGGSIAWVNTAVGNRLEVGPRGAGSLPGPAAYGLGGKEPTVTDADLVLGLIDPTGYFGGSLKLRPALAEEAIRKHIAEPLGISVVEAALRIRRIVDANMADVIARETLLRGYDPRKFVLMAFGGAGPTHCTGFAGHLGISKIYVLPTSPVFCAWGSSTMPVVHIYQLSRRLDLLEPVSQKLLADFESFNSAVAELRSQAERDLRAEGYDPVDAVLTLELDIKFGGQFHLHRASSPVLEITSDDDVKAVYERFAQEYAEVFSPLNVFPEGGVEIHNFVLRAQTAPPDWELPTHPLEGRDAAAALKGSRTVHWPDGEAQTPVYAQDLLRAGNAVPGPCIVEAPYTTVVVEPGYSLEVDQHLNFVITADRQGES
ncbi:N-methylhydantoinase A/acetophenone carboxylase [Quadrisphaera granulorum]|uniref:N-methylhydantoinase A/acetophenone carboxylase n=1 Tax=Quadrisphaera granulorum TaxID=317664 RepID=A0A316ABH7_9ACTN|nr:hydantoinase/oxoprolinase family protein [Quadrisphaera granulorum]PWJ54380.1 N-methylhydantoinase A/acetophenone carboxylase [Quadrisphaera granulorum]SZE96152.1 N-methylhydantoinase A/acetophenone carboxylase [Quadrisphaera granulorum]